MIKLKDLKHYISNTDRLSICIKETMDYKNFMCLRDVGNKYDELYVYGIGMIESEFYQIDKFEFSTNRNDGELTLLPCIEIVLSAKPGEL